MDTSAAPRDPDLQHLADLLDFLPGPDDQEFWRQVDGGLDLPLDALAVSLHVLHESAPHDGHIVQLAECLMAVFDWERPELTELLDERLRRLDLPVVTLGRHWINDLTTTCWRLCVRHNADGSWATKWPGAPPQRAATPATARDPDLRHLADLIGFLPGPDDPHFWEDLPKEDSTPYVLEKLVGKLRNLRQPAPDPAYLADLAEYLMRFFSADTQAMHDLIGRRVDSVPSELAGRHWLADFRSTCWRVYVRYKGQLRSHRWEDKWPEDFQGWYRQQREGDHE